MGHDIILKKYYYNIKIKLTKGVVDCASKYKGFPFKNPIREVTLISKKEKETYNNKKN